MEITWYGNSCFRITERNLATVVTDPFDSGVAGYNPLKLKAEIVTISSDDPSHNYTSAVKGSPFVIDGPGEYERGGVFITGIQTTPLLAESTVIRNTNYGQITILHLGQANLVPNQTLVEELGNINVALVPVGSGGGLNASKAAEVISMLEPNVVIPMHYQTPHSLLELDPLSKFLKEMGLTELETMESYKIPATGNFSEEGTQVIALDPKLSSL